MREILFRAQSRKKGEKVMMDGTPVDGNWVYGGLSVHGTHAAAHSLICDAGTCKKIPVYADTVGQFTGLTDVNGVKIFESDIVKINNSKDNAYIDFVGFSWQCLTPKYPYYRHRLENTPDKYEVIGNIHDNPELLKEDEA